MAWLPAVEGDASEGTTSPACAIPEGPTHAVDPVTGRAACGRESVGLEIVADLTWPLPGFAAVDTCPRCEQVTSVAEGSDPGA